MLFGELKNGSFYFLKFCQNPNSLEKYQKLLISSISNIFEEIEEIRSFLIIFHFSDKNEIN